MTPEELRADVPALADGDAAYLNYGAHGPSPSYAVDAAQVPGQRAMDVTEWGAGFYRLIRTRRPVSPHARLATEASRRHRRRTKSTRLPTRSETHT